MLNVDANWQLLLGLPALSLTQEELESAYWGLAISEYDGRLEPAEISPASAEVFLSLRRPQNWYTSLRDTLKYLGIEAYDGEKYQTTSQSQVDLSTLYDCEFRDFRPLDPQLEAAERHGTVSIEGQLSKGAGALQLQYDKCHAATHELSGHSIAIGKPVPWVLDYMAFQGTEAFKDFKVQLALDPVTGVETSEPTGYVGYRRAQHDTLIGDSEIVVLQDARGIHGADGQRYLRWYEEIKLKDQLALVAAEGILSAAPFGSVAVKYQAFEPPADFEPADDPAIYQYTFTGKDGASFVESLHVCRYTHITMDSDGDGVDDLARYQPEYGFVDAASYLEFRPVGEVTHPPVFTRWQNVSILPAETGGVVADIGTYWDLDTPTELLQVRYHWTINGVAHEPSEEALYNGDDLVRGSWVSVYVTVSDGENTIRTDEEFITYHGP